MASSLLVIGRSYRNQLNCNNLKNKNVFLNVLWYIWNLHQILNILKKKMTLIGYVFLKLEIAKDVVS